MNQGAQLLLRATGEQGLQIDSVLDFTSFQNLESTGSRVALTGIWNKSLVRSFTSFLNCLSLGSTLPDALDVTKAWYSHFLLAQTYVTGVAGSLVSAACERATEEAANLQSRLGNAFKSFHCSVLTAVRVTPVALAGA